MDKISAPLRNHPKVTIVKSFLGFVSLLVRRSDSLGFEGLAPDFCFAFFFFFFSLFWFWFLDVVPDVLEGVIFYYLSFFFPLLVLVCLFGLRSMDVGFLQGNR